MGFDGISRVITVVPPDEKISLYSVLFIMQISFLDICLTPFAVYLLTSAPNLLYMLNIWVGVNYKQCNHKA